MISIPCDEKFIKQYYRSKSNANFLIETFNLLLGDLTDEDLYKYRKIIDQLKCQDDDEEGNNMLMDSFLSYQGETELEHVDRIKKILLFTAKKGNPISQFALAEWYEDLGDIKKAYELYRLSAEKSFAPSMTESGIKSIYGVGCGEDIEEGLSLLEQASRLGDDIARDFLNSYEGEKREFKS